MKKIIALALITSFAVTGTALARTNGGGANGQGAAGAETGDNGPQPALIRVVRRPNPKRYRAPEIFEFCHTGGEVAASDNECSHYSR